MFLKCSRSCGNVSDFFSCLQHCLDHSSALKSSTLDQCSLSPAVAVVDGLRAPGMLLLHYSLRSAVVLSSCFIFRHYTGCTLCSPHPSVYYLHQLHLNKHTFTHFEPFLEVSDTSLTLNTMSLLILNSNISLPEVIQTVEVTSMIFELYWM